MSSLAPPPSLPQGPPSGEFGPQPLPGSAPTPPAPAQPPSPGAMQDIQDVMGIINSGKSIAERHPQAVPIVKQINDLVQQLQMTIVQSQPPTEVPAPPLA